MGAGESRVFRRVALSTQCVSDKHCRHQSLLLGQGTEHVPQTLGAGKGALGSQHSVSVSTAAPVSSTRNHQGFQSCRNNLLPWCGVVEACVRCGGVQVEARGRLWGVGSHSTLLKQAIYLLFGLLWGTHGWLVHELLDDSPVSNSSCSRSTMIPAPLHPGFFFLLGGCF